jgi:membrane fusion protein, multidrug efflux system
MSMERSGAAQVQAAQAAVDNAKLNVGWTTVTSPISGIAGIAKVGIGDLMTPNTVMSTVSAVDPIYVDFSISEQDYLRFVKAGTGHKAGADLELILGDGSTFESSRARVVGQPGGGLADGHNPSPCRISESW